MLMLLILPKVQFSSQVSTKGLRCYVLTILIGVSSTYYSYFLHTEAKLFSGIKFAEGFLAQKTDSDPSPASGITAFVEMDDNAERWETEGITWLIEAKHSSTLKKFMGTLSHVPSPTGGLISGTVHAFFHYIYWYTNGQLVFVDLQGKILLTLTCAQTYKCKIGTCISSDGRSFLVLFNPMTHTVAG